MRSNFRKGALEWAKDPAAVEELIVYLEKWERTFPHATQQRNGRGVTDC